MPRLPSTSCAPRPTSASRTMVFTRVCSGVRGGHGRAGTGAADRGRTGRAGRRGGSAAETGGGADPEQVDVQTTHEQVAREGGGRRHEHMSISLMWFVENQGAMAWVTAPACRPAG